MVKKIDEGGEKPQNPRNETILSLLAYYSDLAIHHRTMMVAFVTVYFGITQALLVTPSTVIQQSIAQNAVGLALSAGLLFTFVLAAALHHACHFCSTAGLRALMAAEAHYLYLPEKTADASVFLKWILNTAHEVRHGTAISSFSVGILGFLFAALISTNIYIYIGAVKTFFATKHFDAGLIFGLFLFVQIAILVPYGLNFRRHFGYLVRSREELKLVLNSTSRIEVAEKIEKSFQERTLRSNSFTERVILGGGKT